MRDAVAAYRNVDGGLGNALEPDGRTPTSQQLAIELGLRHLDECDAWDAELVRGCCDWLQAHAPAEGGALSFDPSALDWPHAPWWQPEEGGPASVITTGMIASLLRARSFDHPWLEPAEALMWSRIDSIGDVDAYEMMGVLRFLQAAPDRTRAQRAVDRVAPQLFDRGLVVLDPAAPGEVHGPLDFAPLPTSLARPLFDAAIIDAHLDHLAAAQREDGGWMFNWLAWLPTATADWRGSVTVDALRILRDNGRL